jgi:acetyl-CoA synthase
MSKIIATAVMRGTRDLVARTDELLKTTIAAKGKDYAFEFPDTAFYLPMIYAMKAFKVQTLGDMEVALGFAKELLHEDPTEEMWLPYLGETLDCGMATLFAEEILLVYQWS